MLRSLYSGIAGMRGFQTKLDVIGNNIANVNTTGFKASRVMFKDILSQTVGGAAAPTADLGGINPKQIGLGNAIGSIDTLFTGGSPQTTNIPTDMAVNGNGFFMVKQADQIFYTRAGDFHLDATGTLVNSAGLKVVGDGGADIVIPADAQSFSIDDKGGVTYIDATGASQSAGAIALTSFVNPSGLQKVGGSLYIPTNNSGDPVTGLPGTQGLGTLMVGMLEMSNVELTNEFTEMIVAQRGFQANSKIITTSDEILQEVVNLKR